MFDQLFNPQTLNIVFTLLLIFQWYRQHSKEQSVKNSLYSLRRIISRSKSSDSSIISQKADDLVDIIDAVLASVDGKPFFIMRVQEVINSVRRRFWLESNKNIETLPKEID